MFNCVDQYYETGERMMLTY